ncbi:MAG: carbohydrate ABC transporter permease [Chloroflexota bacterium]
MANNEALPLTEAQATSVSNAAVEDGSETSRATPIVLQISIFLLGFIISFPVVLAFLTSFKQPTDIFNYPPTLFPSGDVTFSWSQFAEAPRETLQVYVSDVRAAWTLENYRSAWTAQPLTRYFVNSVIQTSIIVFFQVLTSIMAAYAFGVLKFPGRDTLFFLILGSLMVPFQLTFIPNFILVSEWGWANTYMGLTIPFLASAFGVFLLRQFFMTLPDELYDAAKIDGASSWIYLWRIVVPLSRGGISAFAIFAFLGAWNQYLWPLVITNEPEMRTLQIGIRFFLFDRERGADWGAIMAATMIALLPTLLIFIVAQRQLVKGIATTGLKG